MSDILSSKHTIEDGLPQGSSLSCTLFLIFLNDLPGELKSQKAMYADDLVIWHSHKYVRQNARHLNADLERLMRYCKKWKLSINSEKTVYTTFTLSPKAAKRELEIRIGDQLARKDDQPTYLGVQLDNRLSFSYHTENIVKKTNKRLRLIKHLASTSWGSDMDTLRTLYIGYIRSALDYNQIFQLTGNASNQAELNKVQNHALRFICGGMKSTPTSACEIHTNIEPHGIRRQKAALEALERYRRFDPGHPAKVLVESWKPRNRIKHQSIMHHMKKLESKVHLPKDRTPIERMQLVGPHSAPKAPEISSHLRGKANKQTDPIELRSQAEDTIAQYPDNWTHVYTDGSAFKGSINAGCGILIHFPDGQKQEISKACGHFCSNYTAELIGIETAITHLQTLFQATPNQARDTVIFTDSLSALQAIENNPAQNPETLSIARQINTMTRNYGIRVILQWIPGHIGLAGNEQADRFAKKGAHSIQPERPVPYQTTKNIIKQAFREEWMNEWAKGDTGRKVYDHMNTIKPKDNLKLLNRSDQTTIFRLRTQHITLNQHLNRINPEIPPLCPLCDHHQESVEHFLFLCPNLTDLRQQLLPPIPSLENTLYSDKDQLLNTSKFYNMAMSRRMRVHRLLD